MTIAPDATPLAFDDLAGAIAAIRERGLRLSTSRRIVLEALFDADGPVSAERLARRFSLDPTSVYRNLETLERAGLVRHVHLGHGPGLYALLGHGEREYLYCERCGAVRAMTPDELDPVREQLKQRFGYEARFTHFAIVGTCPACSGQDQRSASPPDAVGDRATMDEHAHSHSHGDHVHSHPHPHHEGRESQHEHRH